jgi:hypothetical protein
MFPLASFFQASESVATRRFDSPLKLAVLTHSEEYGQASVHITVSSTLVERYGDAVDVHICSMGRVAARVPEHVTFHKIDGLGMIPQYILNQELKSPGLRPRTFSDLPFLGRDLDPCSTRRSLMFGLKLKKQLPAET